MYNVINTNFVGNHNMFSLIVDIENIYRAYLNACRGKLKYKADAVMFTSDLANNLMKLREAILNGTYKSLRYKYSVISDTKRREIWIPHFVDKVVQHALNNVLREFYEPKFISDSYACIRGRGNQKAVFRLQQFLRRSTKQYKTPYLVKLDISKFFYSIDKQVMLNILRKDIICVRSMSLIETIINSFQPLRPGLPLGNLTSQQFANILLHQVDLLIKHKYKIKYYLRYADDLFLIVEDKQKAHELLHNIIKFINKELKLVCNPVKCYIQDLKKKENISGLGFNIFVNKITLLSTFKKRFRKHIKTGDLKSINSCYSHMRIADCYGFIKKTIQGTNIKFQDDRFYI